MSIVSEGQPVNQIFREWLSHASLIVRQWVTHAGSLCAQLVSQSVSWFSRSVVHSALVGTLSIDNETDDDDVSQPRQTVPRVSSSAGKTKFKKCSFPDSLVLRSFYYLATIARALWLTAKQVLFSCDDQALLTRCPRHTQSFGSLVEWKVRRTETNEETEN